MKSLFTPALLLFLLLSTASFINHPGHTEEFKSDGYLMAVIDGKVFETREENKYTAELMNKSGDNLIANRNASPKLTRVATSMSFYGSDFQDDDNNIFSENVNFEYSFNEGAMGETNDQRITLNYNNSKYTSIPTASVIKINKIEWSKDRRYFVMNADFDCTLRKWGVHSAGQPELRLKGKMENINVSVPAWIMVKNPGQVAEK